MTKVDVLYCRLINSIIEHGENIPGRNGETYRLFTLPSVIFASTPLVTIRKTAWKKAIREMEWFLSGDTTCPKDLLDWWQGQLNPDNHYVGGYGDQLRNFRGDGRKIDQIETLIEGLKYHPYSRRHVITAWNPIDMSIITELNENEKTPTTCHHTLTQFFVSEAGLLSMQTYQRSADMLLGVPHNWIQSWALLLWLASRVNLTAYQLIWNFGDAHIYDEPSHLEIVNKIRRLYLQSEDDLPMLAYNPHGEEDFLASDFEMIGNIPEPIITTKPKLL